MPPPDTMSQQNVLVGLGLPCTPAFENITTSKDTHLSLRVGAQIQSRASNPFEGRPLPPHMRNSEEIRERQEELIPSSSNRQNADSTRSQIRRSRERRSDEGSSRNRSSSTEDQRGRDCNNQPEGDPDGSDDENDGDDHSHRNNPYR